MSDSSQTLPRELADHARVVGTRPLLALFEEDAQRAARLAFRWDGWLVDVSKERWRPETLALALAHLREIGIEGWISALFSGEKINVTEGRAALHTALRQRGDTALRVDARDVIPDVRQVQSRMRALAEAIRSGERRGSTGQRIERVVNIGIGGSDLGPLLVCDALGFPDATCPGPRTDFVSNVDPEHLARALASADPASTLFIVTSKTFTTQETLANARAARDWLTRGLGDGGDAGRHFIAVSSNTKAAAAFGIVEGDVLPLWDWVGGRYSLWSSVGLAIAVRLGWPAFDALLAGAASMDEHFRTTALEANLPVILGALGWWNTRALRHPDRVVVPYAQALARLPAYLQQLVLESNGKRVTRTGEPVTGPTSPALWGEPGTNGQHAFFQWLHQGTREAPVEFIVPVRAAHPIADQQALLVANAIAQAQALLVGRDADTVAHELGAALDDKAREAAIAARVCPGNRASTMILMPELDARRMGQLLALYEHRTFVEATLFGINPFDQFGVELGKTLAKPIIAALAEGTALPPGTDASTAALVAHSRTVLAGQRGP